MINMHPQGLVVFWYTYFVDVAPPHSWQVRLFAYLAMGPGRNAMLQLFADSGNFSRRLLSVKANGKFSGPEATPELFFKVRRYSLSDRLFQGCIHVVQHVVDVHKSHAHKSHAHKSL